MFSVAMEPAKKESFDTRDAGHFNRAIQDFNQTANGGLLLWPTTVYLLGVIAMLGRLCF